MVLDSSILYSFKSVQIVLFNYHMKCVLQLNMLKNYYPAYPKGLVNIKTCKVKRRKAL